MIREVSDGFDPRTARPRDLDYAERARLRSRNARARSARAAAARAAAGSGCGSYHTSISSTTVGWPFPPSSRSTGSPRLPPRARARARRSGPARRREALDPVLLSHPRREAVSTGSSARSPRPGPRPTRSRSPIRTSAGPKLESVRFSPNVPGVGAAPSFRPPRVVLRAVEIERLVRPAVTLLVRDHVAGQTRGVRRSRAQPGSCGCRWRSSARGCRSASLGLGTAAGVDGDDLSPWASWLNSAAGSKRSFARFRPAGTRVG